MATEFHLTGKHVLATLAGFFLMILTVNIIFINLAVKTFPGEKEEKSYLQGLNYNDRLVTRAEQASLGWIATIEEALLVGDRLQLKIAITSGDDVPVSHLVMTGILSRPASSVQDRAFAFAAIGNGEYAASLPAATGVWDLEGKAVNNDNDEFEFKNRLILR